MRFKSARFVAIGALLIVAGIARAQSGSESELWLRELVGKPLVTRGEVLLAAALIADDKAWRPDAAWAAKMLARRGFHDGPAGRHLDEFASRGFASRVFARLLQLQGGLWMRLTKQSARYSYRELVVLGLIPGGGDAVQMSGDELNGLLLGAERYREVGPERLPIRGDVR
ncbi:MAG: hypothetical protein HY815_00360 [Candidatus Riflebacteria bacterium]|nr:hypothetical protein [Candidatus Riflebacteria bacterium]